MRKWLTQRQSSGDKSINFQAGGGIHLGIGYRDAKDIARETAMEVFEKNFTRLANEAWRTAQLRAGEFTDHFIEGIYGWDDPPLGQLNDPGIQSALFSAQSGYAKSGDPELGDVLIELLSERLKYSQQRSTAQLAISKAVELAESLSGPHLALLSCNLLMKQITPAQVSSVNEVASAIAGMLRPFTDGIASIMPSDLDYLAGLGCLIPTMGTLTLGKYTGMNLPGLFNRGFTNKEMIDAHLLIGTPIAKLKEPDEYRYSVNAITRVDLLNLLEVHGMQDLEETAMRALMGPVLTEHEIEKILSAESAELANSLDLCNALGIPGYLNTAIGSAIGHANMRRAVPEFDLPFESLLKEIPRVRPRFA
ncbi:LPO_1073/Vpar_1526 family protein [Streptomyces nymphaeiformis]|uniref:Uncharacterized protein n=1 Tax=Streptomyces nymphaeiformis TaxID=2663842 RepID=A0A7W7XCS3_9ACTN|nr:LPO_1073/Vpar_1526 family protein [Streptomyces nymphaeiformis]MBB4982518.1 hypothetical protein [Streptomyces nymphaeiformis]